MVALGNLEEFGCGSPCLPVGSGQDGFLPPLCNLCPQQSSWMHFGRTGRMGHSTRQETEALDKARNRAEDGAELSILF